MFLPRPEVSEFPEHAEPTAVPTSVTPRWLGLVNVPPAATVGELAGALRQDGFIRAAAVIAGRSEESAERALGQEWQAIADADQCFAQLLLQHNLLAIPAVHVDERGGPRFVVTARDPGQLVEALGVEHRAQGVDAELRLFLDEAMRAGDQFIDLAPGLGFAALSAATATQPVQVITMHSDARDAATLMEAATVSGCAGRLMTCAASPLDGAALPTIEPPTLRMLHAGDAGFVAIAMAGARAMARRDGIAVVAWRTRRDGVTDEAGTAVAAAVLGVLGFSHFALAIGEQGIELVPAEAMASNDMIFSVSESFLARSNT
jgi:hypothetical protein